MAQPLRLAFLIAILAFPILEIGLLIRAGQAWGFWTLATIVAATAILGTAVIRRTGLAVLAKARAQVESGGRGIDPVFDGLMRITAGVLLIFPGLMSDVLGLILLVPQARAFLISYLLPRLFVMTAFGMDGARRPFGQAGEPDFADDDIPRNGAETAARPFDPARDDGVTIEGEYERVSEETVDPARGLKPRAARR